MGHCLHGCVSSLVDRYFLQDYTNKCELALVLLDLINRLMRVYPSVRWGHWPRWRGQGGFLRNLYLVETWGFGVTWAMGLPDEIHSFGKKVVSWMFWKKVSVVGIQRSRRQSSDEAGEAYWGHTKQGVVDHVRDSGCSPESSGVSLRDFKQGDDMVWFLSRS